MNRSYEIITERIVRQLERGVIPWQCPWFGVTGPVSHLTGRTYSLLNTILLWLGSENGEDIENQEYITWNQIQKYKKQNPDVRLLKGSKSRTIYFWRTFERTEVNDKGEVVVVKQVPYLRSYNVFRIDRLHQIPLRVHTNGVKGIFRIRRAKNQNSTWMQQC